MKATKEGGGNAPLPIDSGVIGGSTGGASEADLARGYSDPCDPEDRDKYMSQADPALTETVDDTYNATSEKAEQPESLSNQGFLGRPRGWQR